MSRNTIVILLKTTEKFFNQIYCDNHFTTHVSKVIMLYILNLYTSVYHFYHTKIEKRRNCQSSQKKQNIICNETIIWILWFFSETIKARSQGKNFYKVQKYISVYSESYIQRKKYFKNEDERNIFLEKCKCKNLSSKDLYHKKCWRKFFRLKGSAAKCKYWSPGRHENTRNN